MTEKKPTEMILDNDEVVIKADAPAVTASYQSALASATEYSDSDDFGRLCQSFGRFFGGDSVARLVDERPSQTRGVTVVAWHFPTQIQTRPGVQYLANPNFGQTTSHSDQSDQRPAGDKSFR